VRWAHNVTLLLSLLCVLHMLITYYYYTFCAYICLHRAYTYHRAVVPSSLSSYIYAAVFVDTLLLLFSFSRSILSFWFKILRIADSWWFDNFGGLWGACLTLESCGRCEARSTSFTSAAQPLRPDCRLWVLVVALASPQCSKGRFKDLQDSFPHLI
jgi:hypothetical protein